MRAGRKSWTRVRAAARRQSVAVERILLVYEGVAEPALERRSDSGSDPLDSRACALRAITHADTLEKPEWARCRASFAIPVESAASEDERPLNGPRVVAVTAKGELMLLNSGAIAGCRGSVSVFEQELLRSARRSGLSLR